MSKLGYDPRVEIIFDLISDLSEGKPLKMNFNPTSGDEFDAIVAGLKMVSEELTESRNQIDDVTDRLGNALLGTGAGLWDWNIATGDVVFDERWAQMLGYSLEEVVPHVSFWEKIVHPDDMPNVLEVLEAHLDGKTPQYQTEHRCKTKTGEWKWILDTGMVFQRDKKNKPLRAVGTHLDITTRKLNEKKLKESELKFRSIFDTAAIALFIEDFSEVKHQVELLKKRGVTRFASYLDKHPELLDNAGRWVKVIDVNDAAVKMYEADNKEQVLGSLEKLLMPEAKLFFKDIILSIAENKSTLVGETINRTFKGKKINVFLTVSFPENEEEYHSIVLAVQDVTKQKKAELELVESERNYRSIFNAISDVYYKTDKDMVIREVSPSVKTIAGYEPEQLIGKKAHEFYFNPAQQDMFMRQIIMEGRVINYEMSLKHVEGFPLTALANVSLIKDKDGSIAGLEGFLRDITDRKRLEGELIQAEKLASVGTLAAGLSHKLRNPLAIIKSSAQLAQLNQNDQDVVKKTLETILRNAEDANTMIYDLLNFAKPRKVSIQARDLILTLNKTHRLIQTEMVRKNIHFIKGYDRKRFRAYFDQDGLMEALMNLYMNAIQSMEMGGEIKTDLTMNDGQVSIHIEDNGPGIAEEDQLKIFNPFFTTKPEGTGLGLALCFRIMEQHNGTVSLQSNHGEGTRATLSFPVGGGGGRPHIKRRRSR